MRSNGERILRTLDGFLDHEARIVIYGRAALAVGFNDPPPEATRSQDVDVILPLSRMAEIEADDQFWEAQEAANKALELEGLYITHLFPDDQVFLRPDWERHIVPVQGLNFRWLRVFRPGTLDLILTKMMRGNDEHDLADIKFMIRHDALTREQVVAAMDAAVLPDLQELRDAFDQARPKILAIFES